MVSAIKRREWAVRRAQRDAVVEEGADAPSRGLRRIGVTEHDRAFAKPHEQVDERRQHLRVRLGKQRGPLECRDERQGALREGLRVAAPFWPRPRARRSRDGRLEGGERAHYDKPRVGAAHRRPAVLLRQPLVGGQFAERDGVKRMCLAQFAERDGVQRMCLAQLRPDGIELITPLHGDTRHRADRIERADGRGLVVVLLDAAPPLARPRLVVVVVVVGSSTRRTETVGHKATHRDIPQRGVTIVA